MRFSKFTPRLSSSPPSVENGPAHFFTFATFPSPLVICSLAFDNPSEPSQAQDRTQRNTERGSNSLEMSYKTGLFLTVFLTRTGPSLPVLSLSRTHCLLSFKHKLPTPCTNILISLLTSLFSSLVISFQSFLLSVNPMCCLSPLPASFLLSLFSYTLTHSF